MPFTAPSNLQQGDRATLTCTVARGDSPLTLMWMKDGEPIPRGRSSYKVLNFDEFNSMLTLESLNLEHIGNYSCRASNPAGASSVETQLIVYGNYTKKITNFYTFFSFSYISVPPVLAPFSFGSTISSSLSNSVLTVGTRTRVLCGLVRGDTPVSFSWLKNGRPLTSGRASVTTQPPVTITIVDDFSSLLTISRLERGHAGNYTCLASNEAGSDQFSTFLDVQGDCYCRVRRYVVLFRGVGIIFTLD